MAKEHPNAKVVREGFEAFQKGDMEWMDQHLADDIVWHIGGKSKWSGAYKGKQEVLGLFARISQALGQAPGQDIHDVIANDEHVVAIGTAKATNPSTGESIEWKFANVFHIRDEKATEVWGLADETSETDAFMDQLEG